MANISETERYCPRCKLVKPKNEFGIARSRVDGLNTYCRSCVRQIGKLKYDANPAKEIARVIAIRKPESLRKATAKYRERGGPELKERERAAARAYYYAHKQEQLAKRRAWEKANPEKHAAEKLRWITRRKKRDPMFRLMSNIGRHIAGVLNGEKRGRRTEDFLGYTAADLRSHVEALFQPGMTWDNYGDWHLDHYRPKASFNFKDEPTAVRECWALSNLQPLWAIDNRKKGAQWPTI